jgi:hypothetical protein
VFLDHRWILFGAIRDGPNVLRRCQPYLEISDPTNPTGVTTLELDESALKDISSHFIVDIDFRVRSGAGHEEGSLAGNRGIPFVPDISRGIITADLHLFHRNHHPQHDGLPRFESYVSVMDIESMLTKVPSLSNPEQRCIEWKDLCSSAATFHYSSLDEDQYRLFSRESYASGFRYVSPIQPLLGNADGPRCFFVYDFNPCREASDLLPDSAPEDPESGVGYPQSTSETTREVAGGLCCWRTRFDLPVADENVRKCHVSLTDGGVVLFEVRRLVTCSLERFDTYRDLFTAEQSGRGMHHGFFDVVMRRVVSVSLGDYFRLGELAGLFRLAFGSTIPSLSSSPFLHSLRCTLCQSLWQVLGHQPYVFPILLPFTSFICSGFVSHIPVSHERSGDITTILPATLLRRHPTESLCLRQHTRSTFSLTVTEESTPPGMATTTKPVARQWMKGSRS